MDVLKLFRKKYDFLTPTQKRIASFILNNVDKIVFMNADEISRAINTTPSSIVRFSREIGYSGFTELKKKLQENLMLRINNSSQLVKAKKFASQKMNSLIQNSLRKDIGNINKLVELLNEVLVNKFLGYIINADKIIIIGNRNSFSLAHFLFFKMKKMFSKIHFVNDIDGTIYDNLIGIGPKDVIVAISFPRYVNSTVNFCKFAKKQGVKIVSITDSEISPLYKISDFCLFCPYEGFTFHNSNVAAMALLNIITGELFRKMYKTTVQKLEKEEKVMNYFDIVILKELNKKHMVKRDIFNE